MLTFRFLVPGFFLFFLNPAEGLAQEWTRFRGPNGSGISQVTTLPVRWTEKDYNWKIKLPGMGHSSPVVWRKRIFLTSAEEGTGKRFVLCLRTTDGSTLWSREFTGSHHEKHQDNSFASATPAVDERHVYICWGSPKEFVVMALNHDGNQKWQVDLGPFKAGHGFGASAIVYEDIVVVPNDQDGESALVALDRDTGKVRWKVPRRSKATYSTPCVHQPKGRAAQLIFTNWDHGITSIDPKTGRQNWEIDVFSKGHIETVIGSPIVAGDLVIGTSGWLGVKKEVVAVRPDLRGKGRQRELVYRIDRSAPLVTTPLVKDGFLFLWSDEGIVTCANAFTGDVFWRERVPGSYYGSPVAAGKGIYCISREGEVVVLAASKEFHQLARNPVGEGSHSTPALSDGVMYLRTFSHLVSIGKGQRK